ncbi:cysteine dioxygenase family protein [Leptolyngbya sp. 15MV]|nr:cysteine dioxygenase family protein [Leptolyngbya sp. 15MV]
MQVAEAKRIPIAELVEGLRSIPDEEFKCEPVYDFLASHPVQIDSLQRFLYWSPTFYTRNLIYKDDRFEMMAICWDKGQVSRIHNHSEQRCWMMVPIGRLKGQNFAVESIDESKGLCKLRETDSFELSDCLAAKVELEEPIHQILNLAEFDERAVSIHIYSKPYDRCLSYCRDTDTFKEVQLFYTSVDGKLCDGVKL